MTYTEIFNRVTFIPNSSAVSSEPPTA
jgi:hypothetical protein